MADISQGYLFLLKQLLEACNHMLESERTKRQALLKSDEAALSAVLQEQQAGLMQIESLEKQRAALQASDGFGTMTAGEIEKLLPEGENKTQFVALNAQLRRQAQELKELNSFSLDIAREQLALIHQVADAQPSEQESGVYSPGAKARSAAKPLFEEKI
jgi:hypothetical protein